MNEYESRKNAREDGVKNLIEHERKLGRELSQRQAELKINERADIIDKKRDWKEKE